MSQTICPWSLNNQPLSPAYTVMYLKPFHGFSWKCNFYLSLILILPWVLIFFTLLHRSRIVVQKCHCNNPAQTYFASLRPIRCIYHCYIVLAKQWTSFHFWWGHGLLFDTPLMNLTILVISSAPKTVAEIKALAKKLSCFQNDSIPYSIFPKDSFNKSRISKWQ